MPSWFWISFGVICFLSALSLIIIYREIQHVCRGQIQILGAENDEVVHTGKFRFFLYSYITSTIILMMTVGFLYWMYL